jgi:glycosyltransferase involved in cell wall biosynthesis
MILFSVVIPVFNKESSIARALDSVLSQALLPEEVIVINDGSTDDTFKVINNYLHKNKKIIKVVDQNNQGVSIARNNGISIAKNNYIALLDADDEWLPCHLLNISNAISLYPDAIMYSCAHIERDSINHLSYSFNRVGCRKILLIDDYLSIAKKIPLVNSSKVVLNVEKIQNNIIFPEKIKVGEDLYAWFSILKNGKVCFHNDTGVVIHKEYDRTRRGRIGILSYLVIHAYQNKKALSIKEIEYIWSIWVSHYYGSIMNGDKSLAIKYLQFGVLIFGAKVFLYTILVLVPSSAAQFIRNMYRKVQ